MAGTEEAVGINPTVDFKTATEGSGHITYNLWMLDGILTGPHSILGSQ